jgi:hypothetical protein
MAVLAASISNYEEVAINFGFLIYPYDLAVIWLLFVGLTHARTSILASPRSIVFLALTISSTVVGVIVGISFGAPMSDIVRDARTVLYLLLVFYIFINLGYRENVIAGIEDGIVASAFAVALIFNYEFITKSDGGEYFRSARLALWILPAAVGLVLVGRPSKFSSIHRFISSSKTRRFCFVAMITFTILLSQTRGLYVYLVALTAVAVILSSEKKPFSQFIQALCIGSVALGIIYVFSPSLWQLIADRASTIFGLSNDLGTLTRIRETEKQAAELEGRWLTGIGFGVRVEGMDVDGTWQLGLFSHNSFLYWVLRVGLVNSVLLAVSMWAIVLGSWDSCKGGPHRAKATFAVAVLILYWFLEGFSAGLSYTPKCIYIAIMSGYALHVSGRERRIWISDRSSTRSPGAAVGSALGTSNLKT